MLPADRPAELLTAIRRLYRSEDLPALARTLLDAARRLLGADRALLYAPDPPVFARLLPSDDTGAGQSAAPALVIPESLRQPLADLRGLQQRTAAGAAPPLLAWLAEAIWPEQPPAQAVLAPICGPPLAPGVDRDLLRQLRADVRTQAVPLLVLADTNVAPRDSLVLPRDTPPELVAQRARQLIDAPQPLVLVVDDDPNVRPVLVRLLQRHGLRAIHAAP